MKYQPKIYARAFSEVAGTKIAPEKRSILVKNFLNLIKKNGDQYQLKKIFEQTEKLVREKTGKRKVIIESARQLKPAQGKTVKKVIKKGDIVEEKINPDLIAGIKIIINDEQQFDGSMNKKIKNLFF